MSNVESKNIVEILDIFRFWMCELNHTHPWVESNKVERNINLLELVSRITTSSWFESCICESNHRSFSSHCQVWIKWWTCHDSNYDLCESNHILVLSRNTKNGSLFKCWSCSTLLSHFNQITICFWLESNMIFLTSFCASSTTHINHFHLSTFHNVRKHIISLTIWKLTNHLFLHFQKGVKYFLNTWK